MHSRGERTPGMAAALIDLTEAQLFEGYRRVKDAGSLARKVRWD
jgi:hypothetical protein